MSAQKRAPSIGSRSSLQDKDSRASEISSTTVSASLKRYFDFSQNKIAGLYQTTPRHFILEYCESNAMAYAKFHTSSSQFSSLFSEDPLVDHGIQYCGCIDINFSPSESIRILIPGFRSYDPAGELNRQYVSSRQFILLAKLLSAEIKAAQLGVREKRLEKIQRTIESICEATGSMSMLWNWTHLQVMLACYKRINPPKYFEFIMNKILSEEFSLEGRDDCKEYLEKCMRGGTVKLPIAFYKAILANEKKLSFELRTLYSEIVARENKEEKASVVSLSYLPKMIPNFSSVKEGKSYGKLISDCQRLCKLYEANVHQNKCKIM